MKKILVLSLLLSITILPQSKSFFDSPFGLGLGYAPAWLMPDVSGLNSYVKGFDVPDVASSGLYASGGAGYVYIAVVPGLRVGGIKTEGETMQSKTSSGYTREVVYRAGFTGLTMEYTFPTFRRFAASVGVIVGMGSTSVQVSRHQSGDLAWGDIWNELSVPSQGALNYSRTFSNDYFTVAPTLNIDYPINRFLAVRLGAGYSFALGDNWKIDNDISVNNVPSSIKNGGLFISTGVFIGFFSF